jgi:hypothetical protein
MEETEINNIDTIASEPSSSISNSYTSYAEEQNKDSDIQWIKTLIKQHVDTKPKLKDFENQVQAEFYREYDNFRLVDDILYRVKQDKNGFNRTQFVLPKQISQEVITKIHSLIYGAHLGRKKTCNKVIERMYRPGLKNEVIEIVKTCDVCQKIKRNFSKRLAEMLILTPVKPNQIITPDISGPLKETERGNKYFIVIIDDFTKYIKIYPMKRIQAEDVAEIIVKNWIVTFVIPESI